MHSLLCLGDSYTIGEGVPLYDSYPYQAVQLLRQAGHALYAPEIIARTGWTTDELATALSNSRLLHRYDFVSLLIGVNNQYRGRSVTEYGDQFEGLLLQAIRLAGSPSRVCVLSIPDWGVSPFAARNGQSGAGIADAIDAFNQQAQSIARRNGQPFIDITAHSRTAGADPRAFTADGLHPDGTQYAHWALRLSNFVTGKLTGPRQ